MTDDMVETITLAAAAGVPPAQAAKALGISQAKWSAWVRDSRDPATRGKRRDQISAIDAAEMKAAERMLAQLYQAARGGHTAKRHTRTRQMRDGSVITDVDETITTPDWRAFAWMLERRWPEEFKRPAPNVQAEDDGVEQQGEVTPEALRAKVSSIFDQIEKRRGQREQHQLAAGNGSPNGAPPSPNGQPH
jgi:hypothetical protein